MTNAVEMCCPEKGRLVVFEIETKLGTRQMVLKRTFGFENQLEQFAY